MARKKRFTKKMLEIYDKAEIRRIAINAMNLPTESAYMMDFKSITGWVFENADVFSQVDITEEVSNGFFRDGVFGYTLALQRFIRGEGEAPEWPPVATNVEEEVESTAEEASTEEEDQPTFVYMTDPTVQSEPDPVQEDAPEPAEEVEEKPRRLRRKAKAAPKEPAEEKTPPTSVDLSPVTKLLGETMSGLDQKISVLDANLRGGLDYRLKGIEKALVTIINLLVEEEDTISSIEDIPEP